MTENYLAYYNLETYLFEVVRPRFHSEGKLDAFDLFSIVIWKANRAKSKLGRRLAGKAGTIEEAADRFTSALFNAKSAEERLLVAMKEWGFYLPMASAILTVLWPDEFTVFDVRVCDELGAFHALGNAKPEQVWRGYCDYRNAVVSKVTEPASLRDKDRYLWGRSAALQLARDIAREFSARD